MTTSSYILLTVSELLYGVENQPIEWSTDRVLSYSVQICQKLNLNYSIQLPTLTDIDNSSKKNQIFFKHLRHPSFMG